METRLAPLLVIAALVLSSTAAGFARSAEQDERIAASFVLALGRAPSAGELEQWSGLERLSIADLIERHRRELQSDPAGERTVIVKACHDAFGRAPSEDEIRAWSGGGGTYTELMTRHLRWLAEHADDYEEVMHRAYRMLFGRDAYTLEVEYWKRQDTLSYALLVGCIENWARRNQPGLMVTTGTATVSVNSDYLTTVRLTPEIAAEARAATGLGPACDPALASAAGRNLIAAGAGGIVTGGRIHLVAAGGPALVGSGSDVSSTR